MISPTKRKLLQVKDQIITSYRNGWSLRALAFVHETSPGSIRALLIEEGESLRKPGRRKKEN